MTTILLLVVIGLFLALFTPILFATSREARGRLAGMFIGASLSALSATGIAYVLYVAILHGTTGIGRRTLSATLTFSEQPVLAALVFLLNIALLSCITALGWTIFKTSRNSRVAP